ncbi:V-type ATP synthase subunit I [Acholeplasma granularum]|uniref:V-type ATP synthase subunit I n=1 Tax=Acholeplasma granularum TaxID=264635 RepID=UPI0004BBA2CC|nr:V-type ATPase 116kDa subunit family protein [Acholeplasma granularum]
MIAKMRLVNLTADKEKVDEVLSKFVDFSGFHPVDHQKILSTVHGSSTFENVNPATELLEEIREIEESLNLTLLPVKVKTITHNLDEMHQYIANSHKEFKVEFDDIKALEQENSNILIALKQLENLNQLDLSFDDLFQTKFLSVRIGKLPFDSIERINYYRHKPFIFIPFSEDKDTKEQWCLYVTSNEFKREIDNLFTSMYFERVYIPEFVHGTPENAKEALREVIVKNEKEIDEFRTILINLGLKYQEKLGVIKSTLEFIDLMYKAKRHVVLLGDRMSLSGFIEANKVEEFKNIFKDMESVQIDDNDALSDKRFNPPTKLRNNWFSKPFEMYVEMYGIPTYGGIDPTSLMAITYTLLFGIMFGDLGQGLALSLIGFLLGKFKNWSLGPIITRIGLSGAFFGILYGEFFGNQSFLMPLYDKLGISFLPFHAMSGGNTMTLVLMSVGLGALLLIMSIGVGTYYKFKAKDYAQAICSPNGVSGFLFYGYILFGIVGTMLLQIKGLFSIVPVILLIVIPIILIFLQEPIHRKFHGEKMFPDGIGGFLTEGIFELFEIILSYVTNTLSFLRVAGFVLVHAGLMMVVNTLANDGQNIVALALGNLFVMGLEGLLVSIQVLRLEFYEMFSRYYDGDGIVFNPIS